MADASEGAVMTLLKLTLAPAALAMALLSASLEAGASTESAVVNKSDLGISLSDVSTNPEGKGDCDCAESLYGSTSAASGFHEGTGQNLQTVIITPAAAPATGEIAGEPPAIAKRFACVVKNDEYWVYTQEVCDSLRASAPEPALKAKGKKIRRVAMQDGSSTIRRKTGRTTACVFGVPNASGCKQN
jgi:hypothetical protein